MIKALLTLLFSFVVLLPADAGQIIMIGGPSCTGGTLPTVRNVGTVAAGTGAVSPGLPGSTAAGDLLLMFCENAGETAQTASGWTAHSISPVAGTSTALNILYKVAAGGDATTTNDSGNHQVCRIIGITTGTYCSTPFGQSTSNAQAATTAVSITGITTTINNALVFQASAGAGPDADDTDEFASAANTDLGSVTERIDNATSAGTGGTGGGSLFVLSGTKVTAGSVGAGTATADESFARANATIVINGGA